MFLLKLYNQENRGICVQHSKAGFPNRYIKIFMIELPTIACGDSIRDTPEVYNLFLYKTSLNDRKVSDDSDLFVLVYYRIFTKQFLF